MRKWVGYHSRIDYKDRFYDCEVVLLTENPEYGKTEDGSYHIFEHIFIDKYGGGLTICLDENDNERYGENKRDIKSLFKELINTKNKVKYIGCREKILGGR